MFGTQTLSTPYWRAGTAVMSVATQGDSEHSGIPARILITGSNLFAGALANALEARGFATRHIPADSEVECGIEWRPNLVILDTRSHDLNAGSALIGQLHGLDLQVCVIDETDDVDRLNAWMAAGASALIDGSEPLDQLLRTINRLLRRSSIQQTTRTPAQSMGLTGPAGRPQDDPLSRFANLTERERIVLAELTEGHCAEEIAQAAFVSISTVRSQIKAILQKLGVSSQLAAVALARRADWSLDSSTGTSPQASNSRGRRVV
jgi:two-component system, NarL family, nitrate/nitrite response regulator NarL